MFKRLLVAAALIAGFSANASELPFQIDVQKLQQSTMDLANTNDGILPWKVGDNADYKLNLGGFIEGTLNMLVREEVPQGYWVEQNVDLMIQKSKIEMLFDKNTGQVLEMRVDGQKQDLPKGGEMEIVESRPDSVTVPAGTFECTYAKLLDKQSNETSELWLEMEIVPIFGLIKQISPSQMGPVTIELTAFLKQ